MYVPSRYSEAARIAVHRQRLAEKAATAHSSAYRVKNVAPAPKTLLAAAQGRAPAGGRELFHRATAKANATGSAAPRAALRRSASGPGKTLTQKRFAHRRFSQDAARPLPLSRTSTAPRVRRRRRAAGPSASRTHGLHVLVGTWNVNGKTTKRDLEYWLRAKVGSQRVVPDVVAVGLQEMVELTTLHVALSDLEAKRRRAQWVRALYECLESYGHYALVEAEHLVGVMLCVFVRAGHAPALCRVACGTVACGIRVSEETSLGNKGGVGIRFDVHGTRVCFVCSHLAAHREDVQGRNDDFHEILAKLRMSEAGVARRRRRRRREAGRLASAGAAGAGRRPSSVRRLLAVLGSSSESESDASANPEPANPEPRSESDSGSRSATSLSSADAPGTPNAGNDGLRMGSLARHYAPGPAGRRAPRGVHTLVEHDVVFWLGDLNYRLDASVDVEEAFRRIESGAPEDLAWLLNRDQLNRERAAGRAFAGFEEGAIDFAPTYKYKQGTPRYSRSKKKVRCPAWCDRILWKAHRHGLGSRTLKVRGDSQAGESRKGEPDRRRRTARPGPGSVELLSYGRTTMLLSDHMPVRALFRVHVALSQAFLAAAAIAAVENEGFYGPSAKGREDATQVRAWGVAGAQAPADARAGPATARGTRVRRAGSRSANGDPDNGSEAARAPSSPSLEARRTVEAFRSRVAGTPRRGRRRSSRGAGAAPEERARSFAARRGSAGRTGSPVRALSPAGATAESGQRRPSLGRRASLSEAFDRRGSDRRGGAGARGARTKGGRRASRPSLAGLRLGGSPLPPPPVEGTRDRRASTFSLSDGVPPPPPPPPPPATA